MDVDSAPSEGMNVPVPAAAGPSEPAAANPALPIEAGTVNAPEPIMAQGNMGNNNPNILAIVNGLIGANATPSDAANVLDKLTTLMQVSQGNSVRSTSHRLVLPDFSGNDNPSAHVMSSDKYLEMLEWLRACEFALRTSDVREADYAVVLIRHLKGAANRAFIKMHAHTDISNWSFDEARDAVVALIPNHRAHFTERALDMSFRAQTLAEDVERYGLYLEHGETDANNSSVIYRDFRKKIVAAAPKLLEQALSQYGLTLAYKPVFTSILADAMTIINRAHMDGLLRTPSPSSEKSIKMDAPPVQFNRERPPKRRGAAGPPMRKVKVPKNEDMAKFSALCRKFSRCTACGWYVGQEPKEAHINAGKCKAELFAQRMATVARLQAQGIDPNAKLNK